MFGHLMVKSCFSFEDSTIDLDSLMQACEARGVKALALTDRNALYAAIHFSDACQKHHIKPIFGAQLDVRIDADVYPFLVYVKDDAGYYDLVKAINHIQLGEDKAASLEELATGHLAVVAAGSESVLFSCVAKDMEKEATGMMARLKALYGEDFYVMIRAGQIAYNDHTDSRIADLARALRIPVLWGNDVRYLNPEDAVTSALLEASRHDAQLPADFEPETRERWLKDEQAMAKVIEPEVMRENERLIDSIYASLPYGAHYLPKYPLKDNIPAKDYLRRLCITGLKKRFGENPVPHNYQERLFYELDVIHDMGFDNYFLIVWDYVRYARRQDIAVGPGRGSAAGSLVAWSLGITSVDPIHYNLLFERFLNPERVSMPDIDMDFQDDRRGEVIDYVIQKYGADYACELVTFTSYGPKVALRDFGKVMKLPKGRIERLTKLVDMNSNTKYKLQATYQNSSSFRKEVVNTPVLQTIYPAASMVEVLPRSTGMHPAGVVISPRPLKDIVPLTIGASGQRLIQYDKDVIEKAGFLKMDFLGLSHLTMIHHIIEDIEKERHIRLKPNEFPLNDNAVYRLLRMGVTDGIFQLADRAGRSTLKQIPPENFNDLIDVVALMRPGPSKFIPDYAKGRANPDQVVYPLKELEDILRPTYGVLIYQEQILQVAQVAAGFSLGKADLLRRAVSKKKLSEMRKMKDEFIAGVESRGFGRAKGEELFAIIERFASYGFAKAHSVAYAMISYQEAYLKVRYPNYFLAARMSNGKMSAERLREARHFDVTVLPPDINKSYDRFVAEGKKSIRYSLSAIKDISGSARKIVDEREAHGLYKDIYDFLYRTKDMRLTKKQIERLIDAGCFDSFNPNRALYRENLESMSGYVDLMDVLGESGRPVLRDVYENRTYRLQNEYNALGVYVSAHPLANLREKFNQDEHLNIIPVCDIENSGLTRVNVLVEIDSARPHVDRSKREMAFIRGHDDTGDIDTPMFASDFASYRSDGYAMPERGQRFICTLNVRQKDTQRSVNITKLRKVG